jgi:hypothetical protein
LHQKLTFRSRRRAANKVFVIPSEFAEAFGGITKAFAGGQAGQSADGAAPESPPPPRRLPS